VKRSVEFPHVENIIRYHVPSNYIPIWVPLFGATPFFSFSLVFLSFFQIRLALFRNRIIERKFGSTKLLYFTVLKKELLKTTLLSGLKLGWSMAMILFIATTHEFQIASHPYLD
jgi:hypothetical protein